MKLHFIGTSHGTPEADRRCSCCMLEMNGCYYILDMGTQVIEDLRRRSITIENVRLAICSHPHGDHTVGILSFADLINWAFKSADPLILLPNERLVSLAKQWISATQCDEPVREGLRIESFTDGVVFEDENLRLTAIRTKHCKDSFAFLVEAEGKKLLYTGDLCRPTVDFPQIAFETALDLIVCELAHFSPNDSIPIFDKTKAKRIIHTHINDKRWHDALAELINEPHPYIYGAAYDGLTIDI